MEHIWIALAFCAQILWAFGIFLDKYLLGGTRDQENREVTEDDIPMAIGVLIITSAMLVGMVAIAIFGWMMFTSGFSVAIEGVTFHTDQIPKGLLIGFLEVLWLIPYFKALQLTDETVAPPVFQTIPVFGFALGYFIFDEMPSTTHLIASVAIVAGSLLLNVEILREEKRERKFTLHWKPVCLMLLSASIIAFLGFYFKDTSEASGFGPTAFWTAVGASLTGVLLWAVVPSWRREFNAFARARDYKLMGLNVINEILDDSAIFIYYAAIAYGTSTVLVQSTIAWQPIILLGLTIIFKKIGGLKGRRELSVTEWWMRCGSITLITAGTMVTFF